MTNLDWPSEERVWHKWNVSVFWFCASGCEHGVDLPAMMGLVIENLHDANRTWTRHTPTQGSGIPFKVAVDIRLAKAAPPG